MSAARLRAMMVLASMGLGVLYILSRYLAPYRDLPALIAVSAMSCAWCLYRGSHKRLRQDAFRCWQEHGCRKSRSWPSSRVQISAAFGWAMLDSSWIAAYVSTALPWGVPGAISVLFQGIFLAGFAIAEKARPDLYGTQEKAQSMDMMEHLLYVQAAAILAWIEWMRTSMFT